MNSKIAKAIIIVTSIAQLIFTRVHIKALLLLENEICGFVMFLLILLGLVTMFETTRIRDDSKLEKLLTAIFSGVTAGMGIYLISIYRYAIENQKALVTAPVTQAVWFSSAVAGFYVISGIWLAVDLVKRT